VFDNRILTKGWHHVTGTYNGTKLVLYVDGIPISTANASGSINATEVPLTIGSVLNSYFNGSIDEVRIYDRALNADEVLDLYNNYGYTTLNYPGRVLVRKYTSPEPSISVGAEKGFCDAAPPASITNLTNVSYARTYINWTWTDPADADFASVSVWIDGVSKDNIARGMQFFNATGFDPDTEHSISTRTVDGYGNVNQTWVNHTARTAPETSVKLVSIAVTPANVERIIPHFAVICSESTGQLCEPSYTISIETESLLKIQYFVADTHTCSLRLHIFIDGTLVKTTDFLGWPNATG
jgi:hypothetical protein